MTTTAAQRKHLDRVTRLLPGYDPWATAGDCWFDYDAAQDICDFFPECLRHVKGEWAGTPIILEDWQQGYLANLIGWKRLDGKRRYRTSILYVPRKNSKSTMCSGLALYLLECDGEGGAEIYSAAAERDQAAICFELAKSMVLQCPTLAGVTGVFRTSLTYKDSSYKAISADANTKHGYNPHAVLFDELHAQPNRDLVDVLTTGMGARSQPLMEFMTTADYGRESICNEIYEYACKVRDGIIDDQGFLPAIYEALATDDWTDPKVWAKANPNLGVSVKLAYLAEQCQKAKDTPGYENTFKRLHLNIVTEQANRWLSMDKWDACAAFTFTDEDLKGRRCFAGLDLASKIDIAALVLVFPMDDGSYRVRPYFWIPSDGAKKREDRDRVPYTVWARESHLTMTTGDVIDYDAIRLAIGELAKVYDIREVAVDMWNATQIATQLGGDGIEMVPFGQGYKSMSEPSKELEKLVIGGKWHHNGNPVLRWMASNVAAEGDAAGNIKPSKKHSTEKIDGIVASVMALGRAIVQDPNDGKSVYDKPQKD